MTNPLPMNIKQLNVLHVDDDTDDCNLFKDVLDDLRLPTRHTAVHDGEKLMEYLTNESNELPHVLFLDLNMPRKNGNDCLLEIKSNTRLRQIIVIIFSTSFEPTLVNQLYRNGAHYYIRKPYNFAQFKSLIHLAFMVLIAQSNILQPPKDNFVLTT